MSYTVIIQARSGSTRLPGKILKKVGNKTLLEYGVERIQKAQKIKEIIIATTVNEKDDVIAQIAQANGIIMQQRKIQQKQSFALHQIVH